MNRTTTALAGLLALACAPAAGAATLTFDFGQIGADGGAVCGSNCVIPNAVEHWFSTGGVSVGSIGFNALDAIAYTTQKPGTFDGTGGETGLGESDTYPDPSRGDYEVTTETWLLIDNSQALSAGYLSSTFSIESIQSGEGVKVYAYTGALTALDQTKLTLLATLSAPATGGVTQTISVPNDSNYLVVQAYTPPGGSSGSDIVVAQMVLNTKPVPPSVPEPAAWALMLAGFGLAGAGLRRRQAAAAL